MNYIKNTLQIDDIEWTETQNSRRYTLSFDGGSTWNRIIDFSPETGTGIARSDRTARLFAFAITGRTLQNEMVRVAVHWLEDISLTDGTLKAEAERATGGWIAGVFLTDPETALWNLTP